MNREPSHILFGRSEREFSSKGIWLLALLYFGSLLAAAIISLIAWKLTHYFDPEASGYLANKPYPKFFDRARWLCIVLLLPYLFSQCQFKSMRAVGFRRPFLKTSLRWFVYGIAMIGLIYGGGFLLGAIDLKPDAPENPLLGAFASALLAGWTVGILEEAVFRGLVFRLFYTAMNPIPAVLVSSAFFAILHFKTDSTALAHLSPNEIGFVESLHIAWESIAALVTQFDLTLLGSIFLVGVLLHLTFLLSRNLWVSAALHAGWVFTIKLVSEYVATSDSATAFTGTVRVVDGYWVITVLIVFIIIFALRLKLPSHHQYEFSDKP